MARHSGEDRELIPAFDKAWAQLKADKGGRPDPDAWYKAEIEVKGTNPISQFRVTITS